MPILRLDVDLCIDGGANPYPESPYMTEKLAETKRVVRDPEGIYLQALALRNQFADMDADPAKAKLLMDWWTHANFQKSRHLRYESDYTSDGRQRWALLPIVVKRLDIEPMFPGSAKLSGEATISYDDEPFLLSIQYEKERSGRFAYLDHPDVDPDWK